MPRPPISDLRPEFMSLGGQFVGNHIGAGTKDCRARSRLAPSEPGKPWEKRAP